MREQQWVGVWRTCSSWGGTPPRCRRRGPQHPHTPVVVVGVVEVVGLVL